MSRKILFIAVIVLSVMAMNLPVLGANISGKVTGRGGENIEGVTITVTGTGSCDAYTTTTNATGNFTINCTCAGAGNISVVFSKEGYAQAVATFDCDSTLTGVGIVLPDIGVPSMTEWGWIVLILAIVLSAGIIVMRRRRVTA